MIRSLLVVSLVLATALPASAACDSASGSLQQQPAIAAGHVVSDLVFADIGGDGDLDLVTVSSAQASFGVNVHIDDGGFLPPFAVAGDRPSAVALADMNDDGRLDILITEQAANLEDCRLFGSCASLRQVLADASGGFTGGGSTRIIPYIDSVRRIRAADFNKDGQMDVLIAGPSINAGEPGLHLVWGGTPGTGVAGTIQTFTLNGPIGDVVLGDFDNDTYLDFAAAVGKSATTAASHVDVYRNDAGTFTGVTASRDIVSNDDGLRLVTGQFNKADTHLDVAVSMETSTLIPSSPTLPVSGAQILLGDGAGGLNTGGAFTVGPNMFPDLAAGDFDEDNDTDLAMAGGRFFNNAGNGNLSTDPGGLSMWWRVFGADFNRDGRDDLASLNEDRTMVRRWYNVCWSRYAELTLTSSPNPSAFGTEVTFTAAFTVKPNAPTPDGTVTFKEGTTVLGTATINRAGKAILTLGDLSIGTHTVKATYPGDDKYGSLTSSDLIHTVGRPPFDAPQNVVATGNAAANAITIRWLSSADVSTNQVLRRDDTGQWFMIGATSMEQFTDVNVDPSRAYVYTVRSVHATDGTISPNGNLDVATTINPIRPADKLVRAADTTDVRSLAQSLRRAAGLAPFPFTDGSLVGLPVKAVHLTELRTAIAQARAALGLPAVPLTEPVITPKVTKVKFGDLQELRTSFY